MPKMVEVNPEIEHSYIRPVVFDIARQVLAWTGQNPDVPILFTGESEVAHQPNSTIDAEKRQIRLPSDLKFYIEIEEDYDTEQIYNIAVLRDEQLPYFQDKSLGIRLAPVYVPAIIRLNFKLREVDSNRIRRWRDEMRVRLGQGRDQRLHQISYYYLVPPTYVSMLKDFNELKENVAPYGEDFAAWWERGRFPNVTELVTMGGREPQWVVKETASRVLGMFDFEVPEKANKEGETSAHSVAFSYVIRCDIPMASQAIYPPAIHQQPINEKYVPFWENLEPEWVASRGSRFQAALRYFEKGVQNASVRDTGYRIPWYNDYRLQTPLPSAFIILSALVSLTFDEQGQALPLLNLTALKDVVYTDDWISLLKSEHQWLNQYTASPVHVIVTEDGMQLHKDRYYVTQDLDIFLVNGNPRKLYHVAIYVLKDPTMVFGSARLTNAKDLDTYVAAACPGLLSAKGYPVPFDGTYTPSEVEWVINRVRKCNTSWSQYILANHAEVSRKHTGYLSVEVGRKE